MKDDLTTEKKSLIYRKIFSKLTIMQQDTFSFFRKRWSSKISPIGDQ